MAVWKLLRQRISELSLDVENDAFVMGDSCLRQQCIEMALVNFSKELHVKWWVQTSANVLERTSASFISVLTLKKY